MSSAVYRGRKALNQTNKHNLLVKGCMSSDLQLRISLPRISDVHQDNMSVCLIPPYTPLLYSKSRVYRGTLFSYFCSKTYIVGTR